MAARAFCNDLDLAHPLLKNLVVGFWGDVLHPDPTRLDIGFEVFETWRSPEDQLYAYQHGTSQVDGQDKGFSCHCCTPSLAVDMVVEVDGEIHGLVDGKLTWEDWAIPIYHVWGDYAKSKGFTHGGIDWGWDWPHAQFTWRDIWKMAQRMFQTLGMYQGKVVDGIPGKGTLAALTECQKTWNLPRASKMTNRLWSTLVLYSGGCPNP